MSLPCAGLFATNVHAAPGALEAEDRLAALDRLKRKVWSDVERGDCLWCRGFSAVAELENQTALLGGV